MPSHYFKTKLIKMGRWATPPLDSGTWHRQPSNIAFKKHFGIQKGLLIIFTPDTTHNYAHIGHVYVPEDYLKLLGKTIDKINSKNFKGLEKKLKAIYPLLDQGKKAVVKTYKNPKALSNKQFAKAFIKIRSWVQRITIFDQFGWLAEEYWMPKMRHILETKLGLEYGSKKYNSLLFTLTKPEKISTTLLEKMGVLEQSVRIQTKKSTIKKSAGILAKKFGWLPVFNYGEAWTDGHYIEELKQTVKDITESNKKEFLNLKNYTKIRNQEIKDIEKKYNINQKDLQVFIDFGLALDGRNEAEYFVSFGGYYLMPLFKEIQKRFYLSPSQLRIMTDEELCALLEGKITMEQFPYFNVKYRASGFNKSITKQEDYSPHEAEKLFKFIESYVKPIQGGDQNKGMCASPGIAVGKIRIIPTPEDNHKVQKGDILVTYATTTDYLPAMKRAAAIITEVGGLTCHAAVVSREFGIPCIVALAGAMKNFKEGELVEVDANKGIVRKIL